MKRTLSFVVAIIILMLVPSSHVMAESVMTFPDSNLEAAIREAIGKPTGAIYESDLTELYLLEADNKGIADLTGLETFREVSHIFLSSNRIRDISPLANLEGASHLFLDHNQIRDISPLAFSTYADVLGLSYNEINSLSGFHDVGGDTIDLSHNRITDLSWMYNVRAGILMLDHNQISDIGPLVGNPSLRVGGVVSLHGNPLSDTSINTYIPALKAMGTQVSWDSYPDRPVNVSPANGAAGVTLTPTLQGSAFSEPDTDTHVASRWQVRSSSGNYDSPVWDSGSTAAAISIAVPGGKILNGTVYYWRVGYKDSGGLWSSYSRETAFTTVPAPVSSSPPAVVTVAAGGIGSTSAMLNLRLSSLGSATSVQVSFEWGQGTVYGNTTTPQAMASPGVLAYSLSGLYPATTYYFRAKAVGDGASYGGDMSFTTNASPAVIPPVIPDDDTGTADNDQEVDKPAVPDIPDVDRDSEPPTITSLVSNSGRPGQDLTVTITGAHLTGAIAVSMGEGITINSITVMTDNVIMATISIAANATAGHRDVIVFTPDGSATAVLAFTVIESGENAIPLWVYPGAGIGGLAGVAALIWLGLRSKRPRGPAVADQPRGQNREGGKGHDATA